MSNRVNRRVDNLSNAIHQRAIDIARAEDHINRELAQLDWHPNDTMGSEGGSKGGHAAPAEQAANHLLDGNEHRTRINQWILELEEISNRGRDIISKALSWRTPHTELFDANDYGTRCRHADCTNWATTHHLHNTNDGTRTPIEGWCDQHWVTTACRIHGDHAHEGRRVNGVLACQAAYRKQQRDMIKDVA